MFSVIIPTYNRGSLITRAIQSILVQTYKNWELIIVDDGSTDETEQIVKAFLLEGRIKYIKNINSGAAISRNIGVENSVGSWITFLDSDDEAFPEWLSEITNIISESKPHLICCGCEIIDDTGKLISVKLPGPNLELFGKLHYKMTNGGVFIVRRKIFDEIGGFDTELQSNQHTELSFRLIPYIQGMGGDILCVYKPLIKIHIHLGDRIRGNTKMKYLGTRLLLNKHQDFLEKKNNTRSDFEGAVGVNAFLLGEYSVSLEFLTKAFITKPSIKKFFRVPIYAFKICLEKLNSKNN